MQSTHKIAGSAAAGFAAYLTTSASRGDYYVGGELEGDGGAWHGSPEALGELGLDPSQPVRRGDLVSLMEGRSPASGEPVRRVGGDGSRVAGIDATFSAPKSVSALWAVSDPYRRAQIEVAHRKAAASAIQRIERDVELVRRRERGELRWEKARSLVAAEFVHTSSRLTRDQERDGVPDPQLHSHVVIVAAEREDGRFAAVDSRELFRSQRANGAWYRAELAHELRGLGLEIRSGTGRDGRFFELKGVPEELSRRWSRRREVIEKAAREFRDRYGRSPNRGELGSIAVATRGTKTVTAAVDVSTAWRTVGEEYGLSRARVEELFNDRSLEPVRDVRSELLADITRNRSMVESRELEARAFELAAGVERPEAAREHLAELQRSGELVRLEGGFWTTRELRGLELQTRATVTERAIEEVAPVSFYARAEGARAAGERLSARLPSGSWGRHLSSEQQRALDLITGAGGVTVLVGEAGTGKSVVLGAARDAWECEGYRVIGTAVAGAAAQRLAGDAGIRETMTVDALTHRADRGSLSLDSRSVVVFDEAGMADTRRLVKLVEITDRSHSKLVLAGDSAQLSSIGAGGLFREIQERAPTATLTEVHRANHEWEREAWGRLRDGDAQRALAAYQARDRLHIHETREQAGEQMVNDWATTRPEHPRDQVVMIADASNREIDQLNRRAQEHREAAGELGAERVQLPERPYGLAAGDEVLFSAQHPVPGHQRVENGTRGQIVAVDERSSSVRVRVEERRPREIDVNKENLDRLRLAYAQHVYKAQGLTTDRALVLNGGWQTDRETSYVALTRAREQTDIYTSREDLGHAGVDEDLVDRLADRIRESHAQQASITREEERAAENDVEREVRWALDRLDRADDHDREQSEWMEHAVRQHEPQRDAGVDHASGRTDDEPELTWFERRLLEARAHAPHGYLDGEPGRESDSSYSRESREIRERQHQRALEHPGDGDRDDTSLTAGERLERALDEQDDFRPDPSLSRSERLHQLLEWQAEHERDNDRGYGFEM
jgi:conjugative relaxase-like TrwC/TraI family protein